MEELSVELGLDTSSYERSVDDALKTFNVFQKELNKKKLSFNTNQLKEMNKVFNDVRSTAVKELNAIQKKIDSLILKDMKLGVDRDYLKKQLDEATQTLKDTPVWSKSAYADAVKEYNKAKAAFEDIELKLDIQDMSLEEAWKKYDELQNDLLKNPLKFEFSSEKLKLFNFEIENVKNNTKRTGEEFDKLDKSISKTTAHHGRLNLMGRIISQIRNSVAAALNPLNQFRKQWNEIIMSDTSKFGNTFKTIGANISTALTPAFEKIAKVILTMIGYVNVFLKALSGGKIDLFAKTAKSAKSTAKSAAAAQKSLAGFDEINDIGDTGGGSGGTGDIDPGIYTPELDDTWVKRLTEWGEKVRNVWKKVGDVFEWLEKNWKIVAAVVGVLAAGLLVFWLATKKTGIGLDKLQSGFGKMLEKLGTAAEIIAILGGLALVIESITGLITSFADSGLTLGEVAGLLGIILGELAVAFVAIAGAAKLFDLEAIAGAIVVLGGLAVIISSITNLLKTCAKNGIDLNDVATLLGTIMLTIVGLMSSIVVLGPSMTAGLVPFSVLMAEVSAILIVMSLTLPIILNAVGNFIQTTAPSLCLILTTIFNGITKIINALGEKLPPIINSVGSLFDRIFKGIENVINSVGNAVVKILKTVDTTVSNVFNSILNFINKLGPAINNLVDNIIRAVTKVINFFVSGIEYLINTIIIKPINSLIRKVSDGAIGDLLSWVGVGKLKTISTIAVDRFVPKLNVGTGYVPNDMLAVIHQGEAVIPKEFNDKEYFGGTNDETNALLEELIIKIDSLDMQPYTTVKDVGKAAMQYMKQTSRNTGRSVM